jgi:hypothetical protein
MTRHHHSQQWAATTLSVPEAESACTRRPHCGLKCQSANVPEHVDPLGLDLRKTELPSISLLMHSRSSTAHMMMQPLHARTCMRCCHIRSSAVQGSAITARASLWDTVATQAAACTLSEAHVHSKNSDASGGDSETHITMAL